MEGHVEITRTTLTRKITTKSNCGPGKLAEIGAFVDGLKDGLIPTVVCI